MLVQIGAVLIPFTRCCLLCPPQAEQQESDAERQREVLQAVTRRIKELGEQRKFKQAVQELAGLAELGVQPDTRAGTALLAACARSRDMSMAENIFNELFGAPNSACRDGRVRTGAATTHTTLQHPPRSLIQPLCLPRCAPLSSKHRWQLLVSG